MAIMAAVDVVWCDFGGVLTPPIAEAFARVVGAAGIPEAALLAAIGQVAGDLGMRSLEPLERGVLAQAEWGRRVAAALAPRWYPRVDLGRFGDYWYAGRTLNRPIYDRLVRLKRAGVRVGLLTNSVLEWEPHRRAMLPDDDVFEARINSHEVGVGKPDPRIYALAESALGAPAHRLLLIDDLTVNCAAARDRGWAAVQHQDNASTLGELDKPGLLPAI
jgi:putative hydrolase of the HAD superfamily